MFLVKPFFLHDQKIKIKSLKRKLEKCLLQILLELNLIKYLNFFRQFTWFLGNNKALPNLLNGVLHYSISIIKLLKDHSIKVNSPKFSIWHKEILEIFAVTLSCIEFLCQCLREITLIHQIIFFGNPLRHWIILANAFVHILWIFTHYVWQFKYLH